MFLRENKLSLNSFMASLMLSGSYQVRSLCSDARLKYLLVWKLIVWRGDVGDYQKTNKEVTECV